MINTGPQEAEANGAPKRAVLIVNSRSRRGRDWFPDVKDTLESAGIELMAGLKVRNPIRLHHAVERAVAQGAPMVIVGGGDGTFSAIARYFVGKDCTLGVLPLGTGNAFARDLSIATSVTAACDVLTRGRPQFVDLGVAGNDYFVNVATVGLTTRIAEQLTDVAKKRLGRMVYAVAIMRAVARIRPFRARMITPIGQHDFETMQIVIGNGRYHAGPFPLTPDATITDRKLSCYVLATTQKSALLRYALRLWGGRHVDLPEVTVFETTEGRLETEPTKRVTVDGEICLQTPLDFSIAPRAIRVMVPEGFRG